MLLANKLQFHKFPFGYLVRDRQQLQPIWIHLLDSCSSASAAIRVMKPYQSFFTITGITIQFLPRPINLGRYFHQTDGNSIIRTICSLHERFTPKRRNIFLKIPKGLERSRPKRASPSRNLRYPQQVPLSQVLLAPKWRLLE